MLSRENCAALLNLRSGMVVNAAGVQLTHRDTDRAVPQLQCIGIVLKGVCQGAALRADQ